MKKNTIKTSKGTYLIRGPYTAKELRKLYRSFCEKYGDGMCLDEWLGQRGKVYVRLSKAS